MPALPGVRTAAVLPLPEPARPFEGSSGQLSIPERSICTQFVPELVGLEILLWFGKGLIQEGQAMNFLRTGRGDRGTG